MSVPNKTLNYGGYYLRKDEIPNHIINRTKRELTAKPFSNPILQGIHAPTIEFPIYREGETLLQIPRFYGIEKFGKPSITGFQNRTKYEVKVKVNAKILPHQKFSIEKTIEMFNNVGGGILSIPCGYGKTVIGIILAMKYLKVKTLVIVHKEFLKLQWIQRFEEFTNARIGIIQGTTVDINDKDVVIGMLQSISMKKYPKDTFKSFGLTIIDECHRIAAQTFSKALPKIATKYMLGLTATPRRKDRLEFVFKYHIGNVFHIEKRKDMNNVYVKTIFMKSRELREYKTLYRHIGSKDVVDTVRMNTQICGSETRTRYIAYILRRLYNNEHRKILVLSSQIKLLTRLNELLLPDLEKNGMTAGLYIGKQPDMSKKYYYQMLKDTECKDIVLATISYAAEALDIKDLDTLVLCSSISDVEQASGRILRKFHTINPVIIDIVDDCGNYRRHFSERKKYYKDESYKLMTLNIDLDVDLKNNVEMISEYINSYDVEKYKLKNKSYIKKKERIPIKCVFG